MRAPSRRTVLPARFEGRRSIGSAAVALFLLAFFPAFARGDGLRSGSRVPELSLPDLAGTSHELAGTAGRPAVLLFGELYNENTLAALRELGVLVKRPPLANVDPLCALIVGTQDPPEVIREDWKKLGKDGFALLLCDRRRAAFEAYDVKVLPTLAIVGEDKRLVLFMSGYPLNFADLVTDGVLYAAGKIGRERLETSLDPKAAAAPDENRLRALRTSRMASALAARELHELAIERFEEALSLDPDLLDARLGLAGVRLSQGRLQEAEELYRKALEKAPGNVEAHAGLARIEIKRDQLDQAERRLDEQVALHPLNAELHLLLGEAYERRGLKEEALGAYKRAAHILLERLKQQ